MLLTNHKGWISRSLTKKWRVLGPTDPSLEEAATGLDEGKVDQIMKTIRTVVFAMLAVFAFGALMAATASAETTLLAECLLTGAGVTELVSTTTSGSLLLSDTKTIAGEAGVLCAAVVDGSVGPNGEDESTEILNAAGLAVAALGGLALLGTGAASGEGSECVTVKACAAGTAASPIEVWPIGLPWHTTLFLMENGEFLDLVTGTGGTIGYELLCLVLGLNTEDTCSSADFEVQVVNDATTGDASIPALAETNPALCTQSNEETGLNIADATTPILPLTGLLTVSSE